MFHAVVLSQLPNALLLRYLKRCTDLVAAVPDLPAPIAEENAALGTVLRDMDALFLSDPASGLTEQLMELDALRDKRFSALAHLVAGAAGSPVAEEAAFGRTLQRHIDLYGGVTGVTRIADDAETSKLESFVADWRQKPELTAAMRGLALERRLDDLEAQNRRFETTHVARSHQAADNKLPYKMLSKRKEAKAHYDELLDLLTGAGKLARGAEPWAALAARWNQEAEDYRAAIAARKGRAAADAPAAQS